MCMVELYVLHPLLMLRNEPTFWSQIEASLKLSELYDQLGDHQWQRQLYAR